MQAESDRLLTRAEVAAYFRVDSRTILRWEQAGKLARAGSPGRPRYLESEVRRLAVSRGGNS